MPVLIVSAYDENGVPCAMNAAWGGMHDENEVGICISAGHKTTKNIRQSGAFCVSIADEKHVVEADYLGVESGNKVPNKLEVAGLHTTKSEFVNAPVIDEFPMVLECKLLSYDENSGYMVGEIVNVAADEEVLTDGKIDPSKLKPITFDPVNNKYIGLGAVVGNAFSDGKKLKK
jgi:flavin reductase (DIM6/NTAB) family NADH-FMN oxidoreductase RutF